MSEWRNFCCATFVYMENELKKKWVVSATAYFTNHI